MPDVAKEYKDMKESGAAVESTRGIPYWQIVRTDTAEATKGRGPALENWRLKTVDKPAVPARPRSRKRNT